MVERIKSSSNIFIYSTAICSRSQYRNLRYCIVYWVMIMYQRIKDLREDADLTQKQIAQMLNCSQQVYSNYELGQRDIPTDILIKLSEIYHVSVGYILGVED